MSWPDFRGALNQIPLNVPWVHHGRDPQVGLDCVGLILAVYRLAGINIDKLDMPYGVRDSDRKHRTKLIMSQLLREFRMVGSGTGGIEWPVSTPRDCCDGDVLLIGDIGLQNHLGMAIGGTLCQVTGHSGTVDGHRQVIDGRLRVTSLYRSWAFVSGVYRHSSLVDTKRLGVRTQRAA